MIRSLLKLSYSRISTVWVWKSRRQREARGVKNRYFQTSGFYLYRLSLLPKCRGAQCKRLCVLPGCVSMTAQLDSTSFVLHRHNLPSNREIWPQYKYKFGSIVFPVKSVIYKAILSEVPSEELRLERL